MFKIISIQNLTRHPYFYEQEAHGPSPLPLVSDTIYWHIRRDHICNNTPPPPNEYKRPTGLNGRFSIRDSTLTSLSEGLMFA